MRGPGVIESWTHYISEWNPNFACFEANDDTLESDNLRIVLIKIVCYMMENITPSMLVLLVQKLSCKDTSTDSEATHVILWQELPILPILSLAGTMVFYPQLSHCTYLYISSQTQLDRLIPSHRIDRHLLGRLLIVVSTFSTNNIDLNLIRSSTAYSNFLILFIRENVRGLNQSIIFTTSHLIPYPSSVSRWYSKIRFKLLYNL